MYSQLHEEEIISRNKFGNPLIVKFNQTKIKNDNSSILNFLKNENFLTENVSIQEINVFEDELGFKSVTYRLFHENIPIEFSNIKIIFKNDKIFSMNGSFPRIENISKTPIINEVQAFENALSFINSEKYMWEYANIENWYKTEQNDERLSYKPKAELVFLRNGKTEFDLAYKFNIYSLVPFRRDVIYISSEDGSVLFDIPQIKSLDGTAHTKYSGDRTIATQFYNGHYRLRDYTRGNGIETYNSNHVYDSYGGEIDLSGVSDVIDSDNNWTENEFHNLNKDDAALDAHWGAESTFDYFFNKHNRNSIDNNGYKLRNYVHFRDNFDNAFWDGERMFYGDGGTYFDALVSLDVIAHEIAHGLYQFTAGESPYIEEEGAINESLSDIWASLVENYAAPEKERFLIGEDITILNEALRSMSNPKSYQNPDTFLGEFWFDGNDQNFKVHTNSSVMNHWFYLLCQGSSETDEINDNNEPFHLYGIGMEKAAKIIYRAENMYFTATLDFSFEDVRNLTILSAEELFGVESVEVCEIKKAWNAVGVGASCTGVDHSIAGEYQLTPGMQTVYNINPYLEATNYVWQIPLGCYNNYCWGIITGQGTNSIHIKAGAIGNNGIICKIYNGNTLIDTKYKSINVQNPYNGGEVDPCGELLLYNGVIYPPIPCNENGFSSENSIFKELVIYDFCGKVVYHNKNIEFFNLANYSKGLYIVKAILQDNTILTNKVINQ